MSGPAPASPMRARTNLIVKHCRADSIMKAKALKLLGLLVGINMPAG